MGRQLEDSLHEIYKLHAGKKGVPLTRHDVLKAATPKGSPLHHRFTWDKDKAAHKWNLQEAGNLLSEFRVRMKRFKNKAVPVNFALLKDRKNGKPGYRLTTDILKSKELTEDLLQTAVHQLENFISRYGLLENICDDVQEIVDKYKKSKLVGQVKRHSRSTPFPTFAQV